MSSINPAYENDNIFAKIIRGEIPCETLYEDASCVAIMDVMPQTKGHCLVIPKAPSRNLLDAEDETLSALMPVVARIARAAKEALNADGVRIAQFNEAAAGQTVFHLHFHIMPVFDGIPIKAHSGEMVDRAVLSEQGELIRRALVS